MPPLGPALDYDPFESSSGSGLGPALDYDPFEPQRSVMGHAREFGVGIPAGAVQAGATALRGLAAVTDPGERYRGLLTAIGEATTEEEYGHLETLISEQRHGRGALLNALEGRRQGDPEPWQALVGELPGSVEERPMWRAGDAVSDWATEKFPVAPGYEGAVSRALGEGVGSLGAGIAASAAAGPVAATALFSAMGAGEAADRAVAADASDADVRRAGMLGLGAGATDIVPVEILMRRIPAPGRRAILEASKRLGGERVVKALGRVGMQGAVEAIQEGGQQALQNLIAAEVHTPDTAVTEGLLPAAGIGAGVGGIAGIGREGILAIASRRSRSSRGDRARATREVPPLTEEDHASPIPDQDIREGRERMADAQATTNANEWLRISGLPEVGQPVRVRRGQDMVEGVVTDASSEDGGWVTVTGPDGVVALDESVNVLRQAGATIEGMPMPPSAEERAQQDTERQQREREEGAKLEGAAAELEAFEQAVEARRQQREQEYEEVTRQEAEPQEGVPADVRVYREDGSRVAREEGRSDAAPGRPAPVGRSEAMPGRGAPEGRADAQPGREGLGPVEGRTEAQPGREAPVGRSEAIAGREPPQGRAGAQPGREAPQGRADAGPGRQPPVEPAPADPGGSPPVGDTEAAPGREEAAPEAAAAPVVTLRKDGSPFKTRQSAALAARNKRLLNARPVEVEGGWAIEAPPEPINQAEVDEAPSDSDTLEQGRPESPAPDSSPAASPTEAPAAPTPEQAAREAAETSPALRVLPQSRDTAFTPDADQELEVEYAVIDADELVASHDAQGQRGPALSAGVAAPGA